ncbi:MAG: hypothetical protein EHM61_06890 [Acidobacteria bacterium]|nr:MAG: hypothetical protein EHM61_06890 [Acidobacteriota bacterium]
MKKAAFALVLVVVLTPLAAQQAKPEIVDLHFHWEGKAPLDKLIEQAAGQGVKLGITGEGGATWGLSGDKSLTEFLSKLDGKPVYRGLQVYTLDWPQRYSKEVLGKLDYVAADALMFPDSNGRVIALWNPKVEFPDAEDFMDRYVQHNLNVLAGPINIWSNPTYLPESLQPKYDKLWTPARMQKLIEAAVRNQVVIEINSKYNIPSAAFLELAKKRGAKFSFGSNRHDDEPGNLDYCQTMYRQLRLSAADLYVPAGPKVK